MNLIPNQTAAAVAEFTCDNSNYQVPCTLIADGLTGAETVSLEIRGSSGSTYTQATDLAGGAINLTAASPMISISSSGFFRISKSITVASVGVTISTADRA